MKGKIIFYNAETQTGVISAEDNKRYDFITAEVRSGQHTIAQGNEVDFMLDENGLPLDIYVTTHVVVQSVNETVKKVEVEEPIELMDVVGFLLSEKTWVKFWNRAKKQHYIPRGLVVIAALLYAQSLGVFSENPFDSGAWIFMFFVFLILMMVMVML